MKLIVITGLLIFMMAPASAQLISGTVTDSVTGKKIPYATVGIAGTHKGTICNETGGFVIRAERLPLYLHLFCVGYRSGTVFIGKPAGADTMIDVMVKLAPVSIELSEVIVKPGEAERIMKRASSRLASTNKRLAHAHSFFRLSSEVNGEYTELVETYFDSYLNSTGIKSWTFDQGRYAVSKKAVESHYAVSRDFSFLNRCLDVFNYYNAEYNLPDFPFGPSVAAFFNYRIADRYNDGENEIVKIGYQPKKDIHGSFYSGYAEINITQNQLLRVQGHASHISQPAIHPENHNDRVEDVAMTVNVDFTTVSGLTFPNAIRYVLEYKYGHTKTGVMDHVVTRSSLINYDYEPRIYPMRQMPPDDFESDYADIDLNLYMPDFWAHNRILAETPVEKSVIDAFEKDGSFGKTFNAANDTIRILQDGFVLWTNHHPVKIDSIVKKHPDPVRRESMVLTISDAVEEKQDTIAGLYADLYFAFNCYQNKFYYCTLPLFDTRASFVKESYIKSEYYTANPRLPYVMNVFFDLTELYKRKLNYSLQQITNPCANKKLIKSIYLQTLNELYREELKLLKETWSADKLSYWEAQVEEGLSKYAAYK